MYFESNSLPIEGVTAKLWSDRETHFLAISSKQPLYTLNSSIWGGGFGIHHTLINRQVLKSYNPINPVDDMRYFLASQSLSPDDTAGMLTAAYVRDVGYHTDSLAWSDQALKSCSLNVCSWVTAGLSNSARAGVTSHVVRLYPGTINTIVLIDGSMTDAAMINAVITATEAKAAMLQDLGITTLECPDSIATGTTTDAIIIACTQRGESYQYAGTGTKLGYLIGQTVYEAARISALKYAEVIKKRTI